MGWSPSCNGRASSPVCEAVLCTPQSLCCPFVVPITGVGSLLCCWLGTELGEWRTWCFWAICKRPLQLELPSWLPSASSHPCSREHNWAKWQQPQWVAGGSVIPASKLSILLWPWAELWLSPAPGCSQALCSLMELHIFAFPESWACWGTEQSKTSGRCASGGTITRNVVIY